MSQGDEETYFSIKDTEQHAYELGKEHGRAENAGAMKKDAQQQRKIARLSMALGAQIVKNDSLRHEIKKLQNTLRWVHRTKQPIEEIRKVIERTIPNHLRIEFELWDLESGNLMGVYRTREDAESAMGGNDNLSVLGVEDYPETGE